MIFKKDFIFIILSVWRAEKSFCPLEQELQTVVSLLLGTEHESSGIAARNLKAQPFF